MDWWIRRLEDAGVDLASYDIQTILVDPPPRGTGRCIVGADPAI